MFRRITTHNVTILKELAATCRFFLFVLCMAMLASCQGDMEPVKHLIHQQQSPAETGTNIEITYSEAGVIKSKVIAPLLKRYADEDKGTEFPDGVTVYNYGSNLEVDSKLDANYGILDQDEETVYLRDNVVLINTKGEKLNSEELTWSWKKKRIFSDKFVKITTPEEVIWGKGFEAKEDFSWYRIDSISGSFRIETDEME